MNLRSEASHAVRKFSHRRYASELVRRFLSWLNTHSTGQGTKVVRGNFVCLKMTGREGADDDSSGMQALVRLA